MYSLVLRQLSPMQKGVQSAHSIVEYANMFGKSDEYVTWATTDKTLIVLDGGTLPELERIAADLNELGVPYASFREEDLGDIMTSISLVVDERVWDRENYTDYYYGDDDRELLVEIIGEENVRLRELLGGLRLSA